MSRFLELCSTSAFPETSTTLIEETTAICLNKIFSQPSHHFSLPNNRGGTVGRPMLPATLL